MTTQQLANWAAELQYSDLPPSVIKAAVRSFYNWFGCAIGGSNHDAVAITNMSLSPFFGKSTSTLIGRDAKADAQHAALINGIASHVHDYDDTHLNTIIHPTAPVASALIAYAEVLDVVTGRDIILALVAGIETECKLGMAVWPAHYDVGWHITSTTGSIGASVAIGKIMKLDAEGMRNAIGVASAQVTGLREMFGSHTKAFHVGRAAQNGLLAALLAQKGFTSSTASLEGKRGWTNVVSTEEKIDELFATLGKTWEIEKNSFKPFPCGIVIHPVIDACIQLGRELKARGERLEDINSIELDVHRLVLELTGKKKPKDSLEAKFSVYHGAAIGLALGKALPAEYEDSVVQDPFIIRIRDKVIAITQAMPPEACKVRIKTTNAAQYEKEIGHAVGSSKNPMTNKQLTEKFLDQSSTVIGSEKAKHYSDACWSLESKADFSQLMLSPF